MDIGGLADALAGALGNAALQGVRQSLRAKSAPAAPVPTVDRWQNALLQSSATPFLPSKPPGGVKTPPNAPNATQRVPKLEALNLKP